MGLSREWELQVQKCPHRALDLPRPEAACHSPAIPLWGLAQSWAWSSAAGKLKAVPQVPSLALLWVLQQRVQQWLPPPAPKGPVGKLAFALGQRALCSPISVMEIFRRREKLKEVDSNHSYLP